MSALDRISNYRNKTSALDRINNYKKDNNIGKTNTNSFKPNDSKTNTTLNALNWEQNKLNNLQLNYEKNKANAAYKQATVDDRTLGEKFLDGAVKLGSTIGRAGQAIHQGTVKPLENFVDVLLDVGTSKYNPFMQIYNKFDQNKIEKSQDVMNEVISKDATQNYMDNILGYGKTTSSGKTVDELLDEKSMIKKDSVGYNLLESVGSNLVTSSIGGLANDTIKDLSIGSKKIGGLINGIADLGAFGLSSYGNSLEQSYQDGMSRNEAHKNALIDAGVELLSEKLYSGLGSVSKFGGALDDTIKKTVAKKLGNSIMSKLSQFGLGAIAEGGEEVFGDLVRPIVKKLAGLNDSDWNKLYEDTNFLETFVSGTLSSVILGSTQLIESTRVGKDYFSGLSSNESKVVDEITDTRIKNDSLPNNEQTKNNIREQVKSELQSGKISYDEIIKIISEKDITDKDTYLNQSYISSLAKKTSYQYAETDNKDLNELNKSAVEAGMNNSNEARSFMNFVTKISTDTNTKYRIVNNKILSELGYSKDNYTINGLVDSDNNVLINIQSKDALQKIVGHETTHLFEGTKEYDDLKESVINYAKEKGIYEQRIKDLSDVYSGIDANIENELTSDLVGELLFTDEQYIMNLSTKNPNLFTKIYNFVKDLVVKIKGTNEEKKIREIQKRFQKVYENSVNESGRMKYSITDDYSNVSLEDLKHRKSVIENLMNAAQKKGDRIWIDYSNELMNIEDRIETIDEYKKLEVKYKLSKNAIEEVDEALNNIKSNMNSMVKLKDNTPQQLVENGVVDLPMLVRKGHLRENILTQKEAIEKGYSTKNKHYHGLGIETYLEAINSLDDPIAIYQYTDNGKYNSDNYIVLTNISDKDGNKIIVPVEIKKRGQYNKVELDINRIKTVYGKNNPNYFKNQVSKGVLKEIYTKRSDILPLQLRSYITSSANNISQNDSYVKLDTSSNKYSIQKTKNNSLINTKGEYSLSPSDDNNDDIAPYNRFKTYTKDVYLEDNGINTSDTTKMSNTGQKNHKLEDDLDFDMPTREKLEYINSSLKELNRLKDITKNNIEKDLIERDISKFEKQKMDLIIAKSPTKEETYGKKYSKYEKKYVEILDDNGFVKYVKKNSKQYDDRGYLILNDENGNRYFYNQKYKKLYDNKNSLSSLDVSELIPNTIDEVYWYDTADNILYDKNYNEVDNHLLNELNKDTETEEQSRIRQRKFKIKQYSKLASQYISNMKKWQDKPLVVQKINTMKRNLKSLTDTENANKLYEEYFKPISENNAKIEKEINKYNDRIKKLNLSNTESIAVQMLGEHKYNPETLVTALQLEKYITQNNLDIDKLSNAVEEFRNIYDELLEKQNAVLRNQGFKTIDYREGYFPHFIENNGQTPLQKIAVRLGWKLSNKKNLPTDIAGITDQFKPGKRWLSHSLHRKGDMTDYNALKGFDNYIRGAMEEIYHTEDIQKLRALENEIRYKHSDEGIKEQVDKIKENKLLDLEEKQSKIYEIYENGNSDLANFVMNLRDYTNNLAGKKSVLDRSTENFLGRDTYNVMSNIQRRVSANMVGLNISSALTNFIPITQAWAQCSTKNMMKGIADTVKSFNKSDYVSNNSIFLTNRINKADRLYKTGLEKVSDKANIFFETIDTISSNIIVRSKFYDNLEKGMDEKQALDNADEFAKDVMAGRAKGDMPTIFNSSNPVVKLFTSFQLEVANQYGYLFKDMPSDLKKEGLGKLATAFLKMMLSAWLYNQASNVITGRKSAFSPIDTITEIYDITTNDNIDDYDKFTATMENIIQELPFIGGLLGGGRLPLSSALPDVTTTFEALFNLKDETKRKGALNDLKKELSKPIWYVVLPFGGGQIKKTVEGLSMYNHDLPGSYTSDGKLRFSVDNDIGTIMQSSLFGQYASENAREYFKRSESALNQKQQQELKDLDIPISNYWDYKEGLKNVKNNAKAGEKTKDVFEYINNQNFSIEQKNVAINNAIERKNRIDMSNYDNFASYEEFDYSYKNPNKYKLITVVGDYNDYVKWQEAIDNIKNIVGKTTEEKKEKIYHYIMTNSNMSKIQKALMLKFNYSSIKDNDHMIVDYINGLDISNVDKRIIYSELGFKYENGRVY